MNTRPDKTDLETNRRISATVSDVKETDKKKTSRQVQSNTV